MEQQAGRSRAGGQGRGGKGPAPAARGGALKTALSSRARTGATSLVFFASGALGLLYEIVWFRRLHLTLGVGLVAVGAVVSAFMLGLALGGRWASKSAWLRRDPLRVFAWLQLGTALYALAFPALVAGVEALYPTLLGLGEGRFATLAALRFLLAFGLLLPPTVLMGASLPAMAEASVGEGRWARRVAGLYALNTLGGVVGTLLAGFVLIERLGIVGSLRLGAAGSLLVGLAAFGLARAPHAREGVKRETSGSARAASPLAALAAGAALMAGLVSIAAEIVWTRALVFFVHNSTYAFSAILAVYLLGIALGAALLARLGRGPREAVRALGAVLAASALSLLGAIAVYRHLPDLAARLAGDVRLAPVVTGAADTSSLLVWSWWSALLVIFGQVAAVLLVPALLLGAVFPLAVRLAEDDGKAAAVVGRLAALNALGSVAGALLGTFVLVRAFGTRGALLLLAWLPVPIALWALGKAGMTKPTTRGLAGLLILALAGGSVLAAPAGFYRELFERRFGPVVWFSEGVSETVAVCDYPDQSRWIQFSDGRGASGTQSFQGGWLYAHLPLLLHPGPRSAAVICFGTGNTLGAASLHPLEGLWGIELSPEVVKAAPLFASTNHDVANNQKVRVIIEDGRNFLLATNRRFDVISEEPPLVHTAGVVNLYSRDFYELASRRLTDDGILAVWLATWELETDEMRRLVKAFTDVFPYATAWDCTHPYEWLLIGAKKPPVLDLAALAARMAEPRIAADLARIDPDLGGIRTPADLLSLHLAGRDALVRFAGDAPPVTDDRSVVDFTTPRHARANFGLGEWVTGGLTASGVGQHGLRTEGRFRDFDRFYAFRESALPLVARFGSQDPVAFADALRARTWAREMRAARATFSGVRSLAADFRALGRLPESLAVVERGLALVPRAASGPLHTMRSQLYREMGRATEADAAAREAATVAAEGRGPEAPAR